jgi:hypothetical protein
VTKAGADRHRHGGAGQVVLETVDDRRGLDVDDGLSAQPGACPLRRASEAALLDKTVVLRHNEIIK